MSGELQQITPSVYLVRISLKRDIDDEEALAELSETGEFSEQATVF